MDNRPPTQHYLPQFPVLPELKVNPHLSSVSVDTMTESHEPEPIKPYMSFSIALREAPAFSAEPIATLPSAPCIPLALLPHFATPVFLLHSRPDPALRSDNTLVASHQDIYDTAVYLIATIFRQMARRWLHMDEYPQIDAWHIHQWQLPAVLLTCLRRSMHAVTWCTFANWLALRDAFWPRWFHSTVSPAAIGVGTDLVSHVFDIFHRQKSDDHADALRMTSQLALSVKLSAPAAAFRSLVETDVEEEHPDIQTRWQFGKACRERADWNPQRGSDCASMHLAPQDAPKEQSPRMELRPWIPDSSSDVSLASSFPVITAPGAWFSIPSRLHAILASELGLPNEKGKTSLPPWSVSPAARMICAQSTLSALPVWPISEPKSASDNAVSQATAYGHLLFASPSCYGLYPPLISGHAWVRFSATDCLPDGDNNPMLSPWRMPIDMFSLNANVLMKCTTFSMLTRTIPHIPELVAEANWLQCASTCLPLLNESLCFSLEHDMLLSDPDREPERWDEVLFF